MIHSSKWYTPSDSFSQYNAEILLYSFYDGGNDAGDVGALVMEQLLSALPHRPVAEFALENVLDYRSRRPLLEIENWHIVNMRAPICELLEFTDYSGKKFLLMHAVEPDINWLDFSAAILEVAQKCGVQKAVDIRGIAVNMPHTRSPFIYHTAPAGVSLPEQSQEPCDFTLTASFGQYLQLRFHKSGISSQGMLVGVPYYLSDGQFPPGSVAAIEFLNKQFALDLPLGDLAAASSRMQNEIKLFLAGNEKISQVIASLEQQYDKATPNAWGNLPGARIGLSAQMADGDKIAERLEKFLRDVDLGKSGLGFKDMERNAAGGSSMADKVVSNNIPMAPAVPPVAPTRAVSELAADCPQVGAVDSPKVGEGGFKTADSSVSADSVLDGQKSVSAPAKEMPPIFKQMYTQKNPYEIWNRPSMIPPRGQVQTAAMLSPQDSATSIPSAGKSELEDGGAVLPQQDSPKGSWVPRQRPTGKRYPHRRAVEKESDSNLYPWRKLDR